MRPARKQTFIEQAGSRKDVIALVVTPGSYVSHVWNGQAKI